MKQLEAKKELNLDKPEDIDWLAEWSNQAWQRIQELEAELVNCHKEVIIKDFEPLKALVEGEVLYYENFPPDDEEVREIHYRCCKEAIAKVEKYFK